MKTTENENAARFITAIKTAQAASTHLTNSLRRAHASCETETQAGRIAERALLAHIEQAQRLADALAYYSAQV